MASASKQTNDRNAHDLTGVKPVISLGSEMISLDYPSFLSSEEARWGSRVGKCHLEKQKGPWNRRLKPPISSPNKKEEDGATF